MPAWLDYICVIVCIIVIFFIIHKLSKSEEDNKTVRNIMPNKNRLRANNNVKNKKDNIKLVTDIIEHLDDIIKITDLIIEKNNASEEVGKKIKELVENNLDFITILAKEQNMPIENAVIAFLSIDLNNTSIISENDKNYNEFKTIGWELFNDNSEYIVNKNHNNSFNYELYKNKRLWSEIAYEESILKIYNNIIMKYEISNDTKKILTKYLKGAETIAAIRKLSKDFNLTTEQSVKKHLANFCMSLYEIYSTNEKSIQGKTIVNELRIIGDDLSQENDDLLSTEIFSQD